MTTGQHDATTGSGCYLFPASSAQQRMYFLDRTLPDSTQYHVPLFLRIRGALDTAALRRAVDRVHGRHEALRTHLLVTDSEILQAVDPDATLPWADVDLASGGTVLTDWMNAEAARGFDLETGPLMRAALAHVAGGSEWVLLLAMHHLVVDGWSVSVIVEETFQAYLDEVEGRGDTLAPVTFDYPDYAAWQREWLDSPAAARQTEYWRKALGDHAPEMDLPVDRDPAPGARANDAGTVHVFHLPGRLTARLRDICAEHRTTLSTGLLALYGVLLRRFTTQSDIVVGTPVAGRTREEFERTVGLFVNTLAIRMRVDTDLTFGQLVGEVGKAALDAYDHQDLPFERVVETLAGAEGLRQPSTLRTFYVMQNTPRPHYEVPGLEIEPVHAEATTAKFDLNLEFQTEGEGLRGIFEYRTGLFRPATIAAFADHLVTLAERVAADPGVPLTRILPSAGSTPRPALSEAASHAETLHGRVRRRARDTPEAVAVVGNGRTLTYRELLEQAEALARRLTAAGVRRGDLVGLCTDRDIHLITGMLGIQCSGAAYVPLDPVNPASRLRWIAEDAGLRVAVVAGQGHRTLLDCSLDLTVIDADVDVAAPDVPLPETGPCDTAYVIYTSGSTGRPKGTAVTHRNVACLLAACDERFAFGPRDVWTMFHSFGFDFSVWEIWGALASGARVVVVPYEVSRSPETFLRLLADEGVTVLSQTPTAFRQLQPFAVAAPDAVSTLRYLVFGGEALDPRTLRDWVAAFGDRRPELVNMYGITETTVHVTHRRITREDVESGGVSPIGAPLSHLDIVVLDESGRQVPVGVPGEVVVRGAGLADGYLNRPALTAERFVPDPFGGNGARMYRSGDLVRPTGDGDLVFVGRADDQVKIRGFRIELGEVEAAFTSLSGVREVAVVLFRDGEGDYLCAAVVTPSDTPSATELRSAVSQRLPGYMVPRVIVPMRALPLTTNGKLDRAALRRAAEDLCRPAATGQDTGGEAEAADEPADTTEQLLVEVWRDVLGMPSIGTRTNYYAAGGDSIRSIRISAAARAKGLHVDVAALLRHPTIAELAPHVRPLHRDDVPGSRPAFNDTNPADRSRMPADVIDAYPITSLQGGMLFESMTRPGLYHNVTRNRVHGTLDVAAWRWALERCVARHSILRTSFHVSGYSQPLQLVHRPGAVRFTSEDLSDQPAAVRERRLEEIFEQERATPFDISQPGLLRLRVIKLSSDTAAVFVTEHHAVLDGWSEHSLLGELLDLYLHRIGEGGEDYGEAPPPIDFGDYVALERRALTDPAAREFWRSRTADPAPTVLPQFPAEGRTGMRTRRVDVPAEVGVAVARTARRLGVSPRIVLLAAHLRVVNAVAGQDDVITGVVYNGRPETAGGDELIGLFLNTVPFRVPLHTGSWADLVAQVAAEDAAVQPHRRYPLRHILADSGQDRLFETFFNYTNFHGFAAVRRTQNAITFDADRSVASSEVPLGAEFSFAEESSTVNLTLRYDSARFDADFLTRLGGYYTAALRQAAEEPGSPYRSRTLLSADELERLDDALRGPRVERQPGRTLHGIIEARLRRSPQRIVATAGDRRLTAGHLADRSSGLAASLIALGVGPGDRVAVCLPRSEHLLTAVLGVLKAGAAYVPVDPEAPDQRSRQQADQAGVRVVLTGSACEAPAWASDMTLVPVPDGTEQDSTVVRAPVPLPTVPDASAAYVIFTSGSTGRPKGVAVSHAAVINRLDWMQSVYPIGPDDRVLHKTPFTFDVSVWELFWPLLTDATTVLARPGGQGDPAHLAGLIERERVSVVHFVPSMLDAFLAAPVRADLSSLRHVICSGEALSPQQRDAVHDRCDAALHNLYGPTEAAIDVSHWDCGRDDRGRVVPIGHPIDNISLHIVDTWGLPSPWGTEGEIMISGLGLATAYVGAPALTASAFVAATGPSGQPLRGYLTGDIGRLTGNGAIEFRGRKDDQVKVRGVRVELAEVEAAAATAVGVADVRVAVVDSGLVAYVTPAAEPATGAASTLPGAVTAACRTRLPHSMVPSAVVVLDRLPLTVSGKLDRSALPKPSGTAAAGKEHVAPSTPVEREVAAVWTEVLGIEQPGVEDDFFLSGGHSLAALRLVALLHERLGARIELGHLLDSRTVRAVAARIEEDASGHTRPDGVRPRPTSGKGAGTLLLAPPVGGHALGYAHLLPLLNDFAVQTIETRGLRPGEPVETSIRSAATRLAEVVAATPGPVTLAGWSDGGLLAWETARLVEERGGHCRVVLIDTTHPANRETPGPDKEAFWDDLDNTVGPGSQRPEGISETDLDRMFAVFSANRAAADSFTPAPVGQPVLYVQARHSTTAENVLRWRGLTRPAGFTHEVFDTDHYALVRPPWAKPLADAVRRFIEDGPLPWN